MTNHSKQLGEKRQKNPVSKLSSHLLINIFSKWCFYSKHHLQHFFFSLSLYHKYLIKKKWTWKKYDSCYSCHFTLLLTPLPPLLLLLPKLIQLRYRWSYCWCRPILSKRTNITGATASAPITNGQCKSHRDADAESNKNLDANKLQSKKKMKKGGARVRRGRG